jgi:hypothetical protein
LRFDHSPYFNALKQVEKEGRENENKGRKTKWPKAPFSDRP